MIPLTLEAKQEGENTVDLLARLPDNLNRFTKGAYPMAKIFPDSYGYTYLYSEEARGWIVTHENPEVRLIVD